MKSDLLKRIIAVTIISTSLLTILPTEALASWKQDNNGWWNTEGNSWSIGWKYINGSWYYFNNQTGYMKTGWVNDNSTWYYLDSNGAMQTGIVQIDGKTYCLASSGAMLTGGVNYNGVTYNFSPSGEAIGDNIPQAIKSFSKEGIEIAPIEVNKLDSIQQENKVENSTSTSSSSSSSSSRSSNKPNVIINNNEDIEKLKPNIGYGTITLNTQEERTNLKNIKANNLIIQDVDWLDLENCSISNIVVNEINKNKYPKLDLKGNDCSIGNITFNSTGRINEDIRFHKNIVNNVYVNTTERVQVIGIFNNIEILREGANAIIGGLQSEIKNVLVKESSNLEFSYCDLGELKIEKYTKMSIRRATINSINSYCKLDINFIKQNSIANIINNLNNKSIEDITVVGDGVVKNITEIRSGSVIISNNNSEIKIIDEIYLNLPNPIVGSTPKNAVIPQELDYDVIATIWQGGYNYATQQMEADDKFKEEYQYQAYVLLKAKDGYKFGDGGLMGEDRERIYMEGEEIFPQDITYLSGHKIFIINLFYNRLNSQSDDVIDTNIELDSDINFSYDNSSDNINDIDCEYMTIFYDDDTLKMEMWGEGIQREEAGYKRLILEYNLENYYAFNYMNEYKLIRENGEVKLVRKYESPATVYYNKETLDILKIKKGVLRLTDINDEGEDIDYRSYSCITVDAKDYGTTNSYMYRNIDDYEIVKEGSDIKLEERDDNAILNDFDLQNGQTTPSAVTVSMI